VAYKDLPAAVQLGVRVEAMQNAWSSLAVVVIVPNTGSYIEAIGSWTPRSRFPVLIDDGTPATREDIARFVRGFKPARIVRWSAKDQAGEHRERADRALYRVWGRAVSGEERGGNIESQADLIARWKAIGVPRSGIVIAAAEDPAWTGALALAAGRGQPLAWIERPPKMVDSVLTGAEFRAFESAVEKACDSTGLVWNRLGDEIDAVAICMGIPGRVQASGGILAMTDMVARNNHESFESGDRWAWAGQVLGPESRAAYSAMCSLFLGTRKAWLFDGYPRGKPWSDYDATTAAEYLNRAGLSAIVDDDPKSGERAWRMRGALPVDAGLIAVNTKGMAGEFYLEPGRCIPADVPVLSVPAMAYIVHSWSALSPIDRSTLGSRWLERGVYAYLGSVDEPFLQAFIPTPIAMGRLASKYPFAAAVRADDRPGVGKAWKLTVLGDPLAMIGQGVPRVEEELPLQGAIDLQDDLRDALGKKDFDGAVRALLLLGRDADVADLVRGILNEDAAGLKAAAAEDAVFPLFRRGEIKLLARVYEVLPTAMARRGDLRDGLWHAAYRVLPDTRDEKLLSVLRLNIRDDAPARDAQDIAGAFAAVFGHKAAAGMLGEARGRVTDSAERGKIDTAIQRHREDR
jgi:hypothetical protein